MTVGYRSIFSLRHGQDAVRLTAEQLRLWLALKGYGFVAVAPGVHEVRTVTSLPCPSLNAGQDWPDFAIAERHLGSGIPTAHSRLECLVQIRLDRTTEVGAQVLQRRRRSWGRPQREVL